MREILFSGKRIDDHKWTCGFLIRSEDQAYLFHPSRLNKVFMFGTHFEECALSEIDPNTISQYTGQRDENGIMIFEGDIIDASKERWQAEHDSPITPVEWDDDVCGFAPFAIYDCDCGIYINAGNCRVIGNIYDNPELLKPEE